VVVTKITRAFISQGIIGKENIFGYSLLDRSRIILGESGDGIEWMYVDAYFWSTSSMYE